MNYRYAGIERVDALGMSVAQAAERLCRFAYVEQRLMRLFASRIVMLPERDIKVLLARLQYEASLHASALRARIGELRTSKNKVERVPDPALECFFDEAETVPGTYPFLKVASDLIKPALCEAYRDYLNTANGIADYGSVRVVRQNVQDELEHLALLHSALDALPVTDADREAADTFSERLTLFLSAAGGLDGTRARSALPPRVEDKALPCPHPHVMARDESIPRVWDFVKPPIDQVEAHLDYMMSIRLSEINVAEGLAIILCEQAHMPWSFYADISRHCWDEMRHSLFGEAAIEATYGDRAALALRDYEGVYALEAPPLEQYAVLGLEVEGQNMRYPPGKRQEWEFARDAAKHLLMATLQDFDWADEVLHVNIARRQLATWFRGGLAAISDFARAGKAHRTAVKTRQAPTVLPSPSRLSNKTIHQVRYDRTL